MSILNVNQIQPVGSGQTITISASDITASSATITANTFTGNLIGIGTDNPTNKLEVYGDIGVGTSYNHRLAGQNSNAYNIGFNSTSTLVWALQTSGGITTTLTITGWGDNNAYIDNRNNGDIYFRSGSSSLPTSKSLVFKNGGILLIGTATTTGTLNQKLQVSSGAYVSGNVGIGTDNPDTKLHILTNEDNILTLSHGQSSGIYGSWIRFTEGKDNHKWSLGYHDSDNTFYLSKTLDIDSGKFISINQTTEELEIRSASNNAVTITDYSASYRPSIRFAYSDSVSGVATETFKIRSEEANGLDFYYGSTSNFAMRLDSSGNLGIGTATIRDSSKLDVNGDLYVEGNSNLIKVCHLKTDQNTSVTEGSGNAFTVNFNTETYRDSDYFTHSSGTITVLKAGWYKITGNLVYQNADGSVRNTIRAYVLKNGSEITSTATYDYDRGASYGEFSNNKIDTFLQLAADDTVAIGNYGYNIDGTVTIESAECEFIVTYFR